MMIWWKLVPQWVNAQEIIPIIERMIKAGMTAENERETEAGTLALAQEFRGRGAQVWVASRQGDLPLADAPHPACAPLLTIQSFYRAINALALRRGHNPDVPPHLNKVTETV